MNRPTLTPLTHSDLELPRPEPRAWLSPIGLGLAVWRVSRFLTLNLWRLLATDLRPPGGRPRVVPAGALAKGLALKLICFPPLFVALAVLMVWRATHPVPLLTGEPARVTGVFSETIELVAEDNVRFTALWVPAVDPRDVSLQPESELFRPRPAVVLVHDHGHDARQLLPEARALNALGFHVMALNLRGAGPGMSAVQTFGVRERHDVEAAVAHLAGRSGVNAQRIVIWGVGSGATAAAMARYPQPPALIVIDAPATPGEVDTRFLPQGRLFDPMRPLCRWTFALMYAGGPSYNHPVGHNVHVVESGRRDEAMAQVAALLLN